MTPAWRSRSNDFYKVGAAAVPHEQVVYIDFADIAQLRATVHLSNGQTLVACDIDALELAMRTKPSVLESRRLRWPRWAWAVHNLLGHPLMQVLAFVRAYRWAFWLHDATVPRPYGAKQVPLCKQNTR